jgi:hypothetical protein
VAKDVAADAEARLTASRPICGLPVMELPSLELALEDFVRDLQMAGLITRNASRLDAFRRKYRTELAFICLYMGEIGALAGEPSYHPAPPGKCDLCNNAISSYGFFVDGMIDEVAWMNMCARCYIIKGRGIGLGVGRIYQAVKENRWRLAGGAKPTASSRS